MSEWNEWSASQTLKVKRTLTLEGPPGGTVDDHGQPTGRGAGEGVQETARSMQGRARQRAEMHRRARGIAIA